MPPEQTPHKGLYQPLEPGYIRLLRSYGPSEWTLSSFHFSDVLKGKVIYRALSYVWGDPRVTQTITCNGYKVQVTRNLCNALAVLSRQPDRYFWIDALCINQDHVNERNHQVAAMADIYRHAYEVLVWLGDGAGSEDDCVSDFFTTLNDNVLVQGDIDFSRLFDTMAKASRYFARSGWFDRCWTLQEAVTAVRMQVLCGEFTMSWQRFFDLMGRGTEVSISMFPLRRLREADKPSWTKLLAESDRRVATDPRDKVFALQGLYSLGNRADPCFVEVNYNHTVSKVFAQATAQVARETGSLRVFDLLDIDSFQWAKRSADGRRLFAVEEGSLTRRKPSIPDWTTISITRSGILTDLDELSEQQSNRGWQGNVPVLLVGPSKDQLMVSGYWVGRWSTRGRLDSRRLLMSYEALPDCARPSDPTKLVSQSSQQLYHFFRLLRYHDLRECTCYVRRNGVKLPPEGGEVTTYSCRDRRRLGFRAFLSRRFWARSSQGNANNAWQCALDGYNRILALAPEADHGRKTLEFSILAKLPGDHPWMPTSLPSASAVGDHLPDVRVRAQFVLKKNWPVEKELKTGK